MVSSPIDKKLQTPGLKSLNDIWLTLLLNNHFKLLIITESWSNAIQVNNYLNMMNIRIEYLESYS